VPDEHQAGAVRRAGLCIHRYIRLYVYLSSWLETCSFLKPSHCHVHLMQIRNLADLQRKGKLQSTFS